MTHWQNDILSRLEKYAGHRVSHDETSVRVHCTNPESAPVSIIATDDEYQVHIGGWHEHFNDVEDAKNCFAFSFSDVCRLKVTKRGKFECAWTLQSKKDDTLADDSTTGLMFVPFWRHKHIEYRFNILPRKT